MRLRDQLLARTALALDQNGGAARRNLRDQVEEAQHRLALAHDILEVIPLLQRALELNDLFFGAMPADGRANVRQQLFVVPWLLDEVFRARADRIDHVADGAVRRNHDDGKVGLHLHDARQQVDAALTGKREVQQQQIVFVARQQLQARGPSPAALTEKPSSVSSVSSDSRIASSSSMMRMRGSPTTRAVRCRCRVSAASSVVSDMDCLPLNVLHAALRCLRTGRGTSAGGRELQLEGSAHAELALNVDLAGMLLHDAVAHRKPQAGALVFARPAAWSWW